MLWKLIVVATVLLELTGLFGSGAMAPALAQEATPVATASSTGVPAPLPRPRIFVASSVEGLPIAEALALNLQYDAQVTIWDEGVFSLSEGTLATLDEVADASDFAIVVLTADDMTTTRGRTSAVPRDNVIFELGFFMGRLGRERTFMVYSRDNSPALPSDLAGVTAATFAERDDDNLAAALGPATTQIKEAMQRAVAADETPEPLAPAA